MCRDFRITPQGGRRLRNVPKEWLIELRRRVSCLVFLIEGTWTFGVVETAPSSRPYSESGLNEG